MKWKTSCTATHHHHIKRKSFSIHLINFKEAMMMMMEKNSYLFISFIFITISEHKQTKQKIGKISNQIKFLGCCFVLWTELNRKTKIQIKNSLGKKFRLKPSSYLVMDFHIFLKWNEYSGHEFHKTFLNLNS